MKINCPYITFLDAQHQSFNPFHYEFITFFLRVFNSMYMFASRRIMRDEVLGSQDFQFESQLCKEGLCLIEGLIYKYKYIKNQNELILKQKEKEKVSVVKECSMLGETLTKGSIIEECSTLGETLTKGSLGCKQKHDMPSQPFLRQNPICLVQKFSSFLIALVCLLV